MKFVTYAYADISTAHVTAKDGELMLDHEAPLNVAILNNGEGAIFYVPGDDFEARMTDLKNFGFSPEFCAIFRELAAEKIPYVRFDRDGEYHPGLRYFEW